MMAADLEQVDAIVSDEAAPAKGGTAYTAAVEFPCSTAISYMFCHFTATEPNGDEAIVPSPWDAAGNVTEFEVLAADTVNRCRLTFANASLPATSTDVPWGGAAHRYAGCLDGGLLHSSMLWRAAAPRARA